MSTSHGPEAIARKNTILRTTVGSQVHGIAIEGTDDHDEMGIYIPPPSMILRPLVEREPDLERVVSRTQDEGQRSGPGDTDLVMYSLRKYLGLAVKGNPTVLLPLFAPEEDVHEQTRTGEMLRSMRNRFLTVEAARAFTGYMRDQVARMGGWQTGKMPNRPELIEAHGYDTKYASHALRLSYQGLEIATCGTLTLPMPQEHREQVLSVKRGEWTKEQTVSRIEQNLERITEAKFGAGGLPSTVDRDLIDAVCTQWHINHWRDQSLVP